MVAETIPSPHPSQQQQNLFAFLGDVVLKVFILLLHMYMQCRMQMPDCHKGKGWTLVGYSATATLLASSPHVEKGEDLCMCPVFAPGGANKTSECLALPFLQQAQE